MGQPSHQQYRKLHPWEGRGLPSVFSSSCIFLTTAEPVSAFHLLSFFTFPLHFHLHQVLTEITPLFFSLPASKEFFIVLDAAAQCRSDVPSKCYLRHNGIWFENKFKKNNETNFTIAIHLTTQTARIAACNVIVKLQSNRSRRRHSV